MSGFRDSVIRGKVLPVLVRAINPNRTRTESATPDGWDNCVRWERPDGPF